MPKGMRKKLSKEKLIRLYKIEGQSLHDIHKCLNSDTIPQANKDCDFCKYREEIENILQKK